MLVTGSTYTLEVPEDRPRAVLRGADGRVWSVLSLLATADRVDARDETLPGVTTAVVEDGDVTRIEVTQPADAWSQKVVSVTCRSDRVEVALHVEGGGWLTEVSLLGGRAVLPSGAAGAFRSSLGFATVFVPTPTEPIAVARPAASAAVLSAVGDAEAGRLNGVFSPPPLCFAFGREEATRATRPPAGEWLAAWLEASVGEMTFTQVGYSPLDGGFRFTLDYEAHTVVDGAWTSPTLVLKPTASAWSAVAEYAAAVTPLTAVAAPPPAWWGEPIFCGWGAQCVLDALCLFHLQGVRPDEVEADIRRLALTCGLDRETARRSLFALATDGWISRTQPAAGRRAARWSIDPGGAVHSRISELLSQADPRPARTGSALRSALLNQLAERLNDNAHDAFATGGLGADAGTLYGRLREPMDAVQCSHLLGWSIEKTTSVFERLNAVGLVEWRERCWQRTDSAQIDQVAVALGTNGAARRRADLYAVERDLWAWWRTELDQLRMYRRGCQRIRHAASWPPHPRRRNGRADFAAARRTLRRRPKTLVGLVSLRGTPEAAAISRPTFAALSPRTTLNRTGPGLPGRVTPGSSERSRSENFAPGRPPTALLLTSGR